MERALLHMMTMEGSLPYWASADIFCNIASLLLLWGMLQQEVREIGGLQ